MGPLTPAACPPQVPAVQQAFCITSLPGGPDAENHGTLLVKLGAPTGPAHPVRPTREVVQEAAAAFGPVRQVWEDSANEEGLWWGVHFADAQDAEVSTEFGPGFRGIRA